MLRLILHLTNICGAILSRNDGILSLCGHYELLDLRSDVLSREKFLACKLIKAIVESTMLLPDTLWLTILLGCPEITISDCYFVIQFVI